jgi:Holin of 3TMs, for gene-transfer release
LSEKEYERMSLTEKKNEDWMNSKWRPMMGWMYMLVCMCDFIVFPVLWGILQAFLHNNGNNAVVQQWNPLTLQGAGLFHLAMGAVLGLSAWGRTQEKLNGANNGGISLPSSGPSTFSPPSTGGFGSSSSGFSNPASTPNSFSGSGFGSSSAFPTATATATTTVSTTTVTDTTSAPVPVSSKGHKVFPAAAQPEI